MAPKLRRYEIDFNYNLKIFWSFLRNYKFILILIMFLILIHELKQITDKFLFKVVIDGGADFAAGIITSAVFINILIIVAIVFIGAMLTSVFGNWLKLHLLHRLETNLMADLKRRSFNHILKLDHEFHTTHKTGGLISRLLRGSSAIERMVDIMVYNFAPIIVQVIAVTLAIVYFYWVPAVVILITMVIFIFFNLKVLKAQEKSKILANKTEDREKANVADIFTNIDSIRYFGKEKLIQRKYKKLSENTKNRYRINWDYFRWLSSGQSLILGLGTFFLIYFPLMKFIAGEMTIGTIIFIYTIYIGLIGPMFSFVSGVKNYYRAMADFQELFYYYKIEPKIKDKPGAKKLNIREGSIEFKDVGFNYGKRKIFRNFNLKIPKNKKFALVGHSGCGKTTLIKLLYRLYDVDSGQVLIDGKDIRDFKQELLREEMSVVPQECILFDDTIYNNIAFSNLKATRKQIMKSIKFAQLDKIIKDFPNGVNTIVGERGVKLSGGEKQRVNIARAILADKKILALDEATSSLDSETEHEIQRDLEKLMQGRTSIIIAHRLSTIMHADKIIVMQKGKIVQTGTHNQLIKKPGEYKHLWNLQKGGYIK